MAPLFPTGINQSVVQGNAVNRSYGTTPARRIASSQAHLKPEAEQNSKHQPKNKLNNDHTL